MTATTVSGDKRLHQFRVQVGSCSTLADQWLLPGDGAATANRKMKLVLPA
jgi:hypothetical protein